MIYDTKASSDSPSDVASMAIWLLRWQAGKSPGDMAWQMQLDKRISLTAESDLLYSLETPNISGLMHQGVYNLS